MPTFYLKKVKYEHALERTHLVKITVMEFLDILNTNAMLIIFDEQLLTISLCIKRVRLNWNFIVYDVQNKNTHVFIKLKTIFNLW